MTTPAKKKIPGMTKSKPKVKKFNDFIPQVGHIVLRTPEEMYPKGNIKLLYENWRRMVDEKAQKYAAGKLEVVAVGEGCTFSEVGGFVSLGSNTRIQSIEIFDDNEEDTPERLPVIWWVVRDMEPIAKYKK